MSASEHVAQRYPKSMIRQIRSGFGKVKLQRVATSVAPDNPAFGLAGFDDTGIRVTPGKIQRYPLPQRFCRVLVQTGKRISDNEIWRIVKLHGILYLSDVGSMGFIDFAHHDFALGHSLC